MTNSKWCLSPHYSGYQVVILFGRAEKGKIEVTFISILEMLTLWAWGDYNYKLSQKTWSLTSWQFSSCPWQLSFCVDSDQFQPPDHGCRVGLRCHHQCSSRWPFCVWSSDWPGPAPPFRVSWTYPFQQLPLETKAERVQFSFLWLRYTHHLKVNI